VLTACPSCGNSIRGTYEVPGVVVSRVYLSPKFIRELIDALEDNYSKWRTREGIKSLPEYGGDAGGHAGGSGQSEHS